MSKSNFNPKMKESEWGLTWQKRKSDMLKEYNRKHLILCVGRVSPEKGVDELLKTMPFLENCILWLVGDGPARGELEALATSLNVPVKFWGYQRGEALHAVYTAADCFVCPSLTETFGQTVNEAIASRVPIALPACHVFKEAYGDWLPTDAMWEPLDRRGMAKAIMNQLARGDSALPDPSNLKSWSDACNTLLEEYHKASFSKSSHIGLLSFLVLPVWWALMITVASIIYCFAHIRTLTGGSVRQFLKRSISDPDLTSSLQQKSQILSKSMLLLDPAAGLSWYLQKANRRNVSSSFNKPKFYFNTLFITMLAVTYICNPPHFLSSLSDLS